MWTTWETHQVDVTDAWHELLDLRFQPVHLCSQRTHHVPACGCTGTRGQVLSHDAAAASACCAQLPTDRRIA